MVDARRNSGDVEGGGRWECAAQGLRDATGNDTVGRMSEPAIGQAGEQLELPAEVVTASGGRLRPFRAGDPRTSEAGRRGVAAREAKRAAMRGDVDAVAAHLRSVAASYDRSELGPIAAAAALDAIGRVQRGEWKVRDPADWVRVLVDVARLEAGEATSAAIVAHVGRDAAGVLALRDQARRALDAPALAAGDPSPDTDATT